MKRSLLSIVSLTLLLFLLDRLFRILHPEVNLVRASLVGLTGFSFLAPLWLMRRPPFAPFVGALSIIASAFLSVLLIQAGLLVSRSNISGFIHLLILVGAFLVLDQTGRRLPVMHRGDEVT